MCKIVLFKKSNKTSKQVFIMDFSYGLCGVSYGVLFDYHFNIERWTKRTNSCY